VYLGEGFGSHVGVLGDLTVGYDYRAISPPSGGAIIQGNVGIGITIPTAYLHLKAGTASANTAPLKFTAGVLNTTPVIGAVEFVDDGANGHLYITLNVGGVLTRKEIAFVA
jgi:hypothetical protein